MIVYVNNAVTNHWLRKIAVYKILIFSVAKNGSKKVHVSHFVIKLIYSYHDQSIVPLLNVTATVESVKETNNLHTTMHIHGDNHH